MKEIGSVINRIQENSYFEDTYENIKVGTPCTIYHYSDRDAYEVVEVMDQQHLRIRELNAERVDDNGMSDCQEYKYTSNPKNPTKEIKLTKYGWRTVNTFSKEGYDKAVARFRSSCKTEQAAKDYISYHYRLAGLTENQLAKVLAGGTVSKMGEKINISFGVADKYFDFSF